MTLWLSGTINESDISIPNNTSNVTVNIYANWNWGTWAADNPDGTITIDGTNYAFKANFNTGESSSGSQLLMTKSKIVTHNSDGSKTVSCACEYDGNGDYTVSWSDSKSLTNIPRASVLGTVSAFNLEDAFSASVTKYSASFTDKLELFLDSSLIATRSAYTNAAAVSLTDDEILTAYRLMGTSETDTFTFKLSTYSGTTLLGTSTKSAAGTSAGTMKIRVNGAWERAVPYVRVSGVWKKALGLSYNSSWKRGKA